MLSVSAHLYFSVSLCESTDPRSTHMPAVSALNLTVISRKDLNVETKCPGAGFFFIKDRLLAIASLYGII